MIDPNERDNMHPDDDAYEADRHERKREREYEQAEEAGDMARDWAPLPAAPEGV